MSCQCLFLPRQEIRECVCWWETQQHSHGNAYSSPLFPVYAAQWDRTVPCFTALGLNTSTPILFSSPYISPPHPIFFPVGSYTEKVLIHPHTVIMEEWCPASLLRGYSLGLVKKSKTTVLYVLIHVRVFRCAACQRLTVHYNPGTKKEMSPVQTDLWLKHTQYWVLQKMHTLLSVSSLLLLTGMLSWMIWWVGDVLCLIFRDKVKQAKGPERAEMAAIDNWRTKTARDIKSAGVARVFVGANENLECLTARAALVDGKQREMTSGLTTFVILGEWF